MPDVPNLNLLSQDTNDMTIEEKIKAMTEVYEQYEASLSRIYQEFLTQLSDIRKKDDLLKLEKIKKGL